MQITTITYADHWDWRYRYSAVGGREQKRLYYSPHGDSSVVNPDPGTGVDCSFSHPWEYYLRGAGGEVLAVYSGRQTVGPGEYSERRVYMYANSYLVNGGQMVRLANGCKEFAVNDNLGSVRAVINVDTSNNVSARHYDYKPYGDTLNTTEDTELRQGFIGSQLDQESRYIAMGARMYDPESGRFLSVDPLFELFTEHTPYHYAYNSPLIFKDPSGLAVELEAVGYSMGYWVQMDFSLFHSWGSYGDLDNPIGFSFWKECSQWMWMSGAGGDMSGTAHLQYGENKGPVLMHSYSIPAGTPTKVIQEALTRANDNYTKNGKYEIDHNTLLGVIAYNSGYSLPKEFGDFVKNVHDDYNLFPEIEANSWPTKDLFETNSIEDILLRLRNLSNWTGWEWGCTIVQNNTTLEYKGVNLSTDFKATSCSVDLDYKEEGWKVVGWAHSHPIDTPFSPGDIDWTLSHWYANQLPDDDYFALCVSPHFMYSLYVSNGNDFWNWRQYEHHGSMFYNRAHGNYGHTQGSNLNKIHNAINKTYFEKGVEYGTGAIFNAIYK